MKGLYLKLILTSKHFIRDYVLGGKMISLCPTLGKKYAQIYQSTCPVHLQMPDNKVLPIFFIGPPPYVKYPKNNDGKLGGSEFLVMKVLAKKHKFTPNFLPAKRFFIEEINGTKYGLVYQVNKIEHNVLYIRITDLCTVTTVEGDTREVTFSMHPLQLYKSPLRLDSLRNC